MARAVKKLEFKVESTLELLEKKGKNISWSKWLQYWSCPVSWLATNYCQFVSLEALEREDSHTISGDVMQVVLEHFINHRVYLRDEMEDVSDLVAWIQKQIEAIFKLTFFDSKLQFSPEHVPTRYYFSRSPGVQAAEALKSSGALDSIFKISSLNAKYIKASKFREDFGTKKVQLQKLRDMVPRIIDKFIELEMPLDKTLSEVWVQGSVLQDIKVEGQVDFLVNLKGSEEGFFENLSQLADHFCIWDGKYQVTKYSKKEQVMFYAAAIYFETQKKPQFGCLFDWSKAELHTYPFDLTYIESVRRGALNIGTRVEGLIQYLTQIKQNKITDNIMSVPQMTFRPSKASCRFCRIRRACPSAKKHKLHLDKAYKNYSPNEDLVKSVMQESGFDCGDLKANSIDVGL